MEEKMRQLFEDWLIPLGIIGLIAYLIWYVANFS